jgi:hypothetical protein
VNGVGLFTSTDWIVFINEAELMRGLVCLGTDLKAIFGPELEYELGYTCNALCKGVFQISVGFRTLLS